MSRIRSSGTRPEIALRALAAEYFPQVKAVYHPKDIPGKPDVWLADFGLALFADGCFFHGCPRHGHIPDDNREYWLSKISRNRARDRQTDRALRDIGIRPVRIWEHQLGRDLREARRKLRRASAASPRFSDVSAEPSPDRSGE